MRTTRESINPLASRYYFHNGRSNSLAEGIEHALKRDAFAGMILPTMAVGGSYRGKQDRGAMDIPMSPDSKPVYDQKRVYAGSIAPQEMGNGKNRLIMRAPKEGEHILLVRTGFFFKPHVGLLDDLIDIQNHGKLYDHGACSFHRANFPATVLANADSVALMGTEEAEKAFERADPQRLPFLAYPIVRYALFYMPWDSAVIDRCVNGHLGRIVSERGGCRMVDAPDTLHDFFDGYCTVRAEKERGLAAKPQLGGRDADDLLR